MFRSLACSLLICSMFISFCSAENGLTRCNCDEDGTLWSVETIIETQKVSDFLIAVAYFSIPVELIYFVSCSNVPFKWVLFEFIAFIVLCGLTHLLNGWTYGPHSFRLAAALTAFKTLTALVSTATAITLMTLIPLLLKVKVREFMLRKKAWDLGREVGIIMRQNETGLHVRMLTREIRRTLDRHTILYTTLVELSKTLDLQNCAVWMPNEVKTEMNLTHELKPRTDNYSVPYGNRIPIGDADVARIKRSKEVDVLNPDSVLARKSGGVRGDAGPVAAIRVPMLRFSNFKGGTPEFVQTCYAILVCVLPFEQPRHWTHQELEIVKVVADQVAVALSHAAILEESQLMREKLAEQNRVLQFAKQHALRASQARIAFEKMMSDGIRRPMYSVSGLLSVLQDEKLTAQKSIVVDAMVKANDVLSLLINDAMDISRKDSGKLFPLDMKCFGLRSVVREAACLAESLCIYKGFGFSVEAESSLPDHVIGDERRVFQVILHMLGTLLNGKNRGGVVKFRVFTDSGSVEGDDRRRVAWRESCSNGYVNVRFEFEMGNSGLESVGSVSVIGRRDGVEGQLTFCVCEKLVNLMQGNIQIALDPQGSAESMSLFLRFQHRSSISILIPEFLGESSENQNPNSSSLFRGLRILLAEGDDLNRTVTRKLLEKLGCIVTAVSSGHECVAAIANRSSSFQAVLLDLHMPDLDGFEVSTRIKKFGSQSRPLILGVADVNDDDLLKNCLRVGINGVIRKPVMLRGISNELKRVILQINKAPSMADSAKSSVCFNR